MKKLTRRKFMATASLVTGFALAVRPVSAQTITTDSTGLLAGAVTIPVEDCAFILNMPPFLAYLSGPIHH